MCVCVCVSILYIFKALPLSLAAFGRYDLLGQQGVSESFKSAVMLHVIQPCKHKTRKCSNTNLLLINNELYQVMKYCSNDVVLKYF